MCGVDVVCGVWHTLSVVCKAGNDAYLHVYLNGYLVASFTANQIDLRLDGSFALRGEYLVLRSLPPTAGAVTSTATRDKNHCILLRTLALRPTPLTKQEVSSYVKSLGCGELPALTQIHYDFTRPHLPTGVDVLPNNNPYFDGTATKLFPQSLLQLSNWLVSNELMQGGGWTLQLQLQVESPPGASFDIIYLPPLSLHVKPNAAFGGSFDSPPHTIKWGEWMNLRLSCDRFGCLSLIIDGAPALYSNAAIGNIGMCNLPAQFKMPFTPSPVALRFRNVSISIN
eukprot:TRINITY_DN16910_c0_g1_i1.p1 TRINITY_DN16910_c0_g1~~TRINITY_DN16910_c0_g1_i1.p1  ORF type:complete len:283 (-),score=78.92 TRINITY_DN16910_c0_g1_i1:78-926(-)